MPNNINNNNSDHPNATNLPTKAIQTVAFISLGCPKNLVDSEKMLGLLAEDGLIPIADETLADAIVINTCGFLEASKEESIKEIKQASILKEQGQCKRIVVAGCLVQRHRAKILEWCPEIDAMVGVFDRDHIVQAVTGQTLEQNDLTTDVPIYSSIAANATLAKKQRDEAFLKQSSLTNASEGNVELRGYFESDRARLRLTPRHYAYLRISEGCNQNCAFCTIPSIRGKMRSKPLPSILAEANELVMDGVFELNLIGQDTTSYGDDLDGLNTSNTQNGGLVELLESLNQLASDNGGLWMRLMYAYPSCFTDAMIDAIASQPHIVKYIDIPLQHINDQVLDKMRRRTSRKLIETLLGKLRDRIPGMAIRTTFISGFPGETESQHKELLHFVEQFKFDAMGVFPYSAEPDTPAGTLYHQGQDVDDQIIDRRIEELMLAQQEIVFTRHQKMAEQGTLFDVLIDEHGQNKAPATTGVTTGGQLYIGRTYQQAPQVDSVTYVQSKQKLSLGELVHCRIVGVDGYDLIAQPVDELDTKISLPVI